MAEIERKYLAPLNPRTVINEADRRRVYDIVRGQLSDLIVGDQAYYPDGVQKDNQARADAVDGYIDAIAALRGQIDDPSDILGGLLSDLGKYADAIKKRIGRESPIDHIELPPELTPQAPDKDWLYVDPDHGPFSPPSPLSTSRDPREIKVSFRLPGGNGELRRHPQGSSGSPMPTNGGSADKGLPRSLIASGLVSGQPMRQWPVDLPIFFRS
ncbi:hypothetical protein [Bradyrhizobium pachyrhizi]|uniref:hypothetical protein n=1 Tax=Bradyrhizobium pachyrhizi TaxID=280333 RepID=UPI00067B5393|nr:hypothetical protein [Bradyrhizobium pachyrhizi]